MTDTLERDGWQVPEALAPFYQTLDQLGFVNTTAPTPDEWEHPDGMQVRLQHVARETMIRYRGTPPPPPEPIHSIEGQLRYDRTFPWTERVRSQRRTLEEFSVFLHQTAHQIGQELKMRQSQSRF